MRHPVPEAIRACGLLTLALVALAGCDDTSPTDPQPLQEFAGAFTPVEAYEELFGSAVVVAGEAEFSVAVAVQEAPDPGEAGHPWVLMEGSCEAPGPLLRDWDELPAIVLDAQGEWSDGPITGVVSGVDQMALELRLSMGEPEAVVACADLEEQVAD